MSEVTLYHGDCLDILPTLEAGSVDAVITDPPYGIKDKPFTGGLRAGKRTGGDNVWHPASSWDEFIDSRWGEATCRASNLVAWFGHWRKREDVQAIMQHPLRAEIVWAKNCHAGPPCPVAMRDERIWLFSASGIKGNTFETSVWDSAIIPTWAHKEHKNEKPVVLMKRLILFLTDEGATVLDPFMGSGTTGVACVQTGRNFIGIEIDKGYFDIAQRRIEEAQAQPSLYGDSGFAPSMRNDKAVNFEMAL